MTTAKRRSWWRRGAIGLAAFALLCGAAPVGARMYKQILAQRRAELLESELRRRLAEPDDSAVAAIGSDEEGEETDQLALRALADLAYFGWQDEATAKKLLETIEQEKRRWPDRLADSLIPRLAQGAGNGDALDEVVAGHSWVNLGPADANFQWNGGRYPGKDSGRVADIAVDPRDTDVVYVAASTGGLWKTYNFFSAPDEKPTWHPLFDTVANISIGAMTLDSSNPDSLYVALGDAFDLTAGGRVAKSSDGGGSWTIGPVLTGAYRAQSGGRTEIAVSGRAIAVDPTNANRVLVATEVGLFRSNDAGASFSLATLPTTADGRVTVETSAWSIAYLGSSGGNSRWLVSGVYACAPGVAPPRAFVSHGSAPTASCPGGNPGDIWKSTDSGATWTSLRASGALAGIPGPGAGRLALAAREASNPDQATVYVMASSIDESQTIAILKSQNGGGAFSLVATSTTPVSNPVGGSTPCANLDVGHDQSGYNLAVAISPANSAHAILGGNFCSVRTLSGGLGWDNVSYWLPLGIPLPYAHADWHAVTAVRRGEQVWVLAGTDGGIFASANVFDSNLPRDVVWSYRRNRGISSYLFYSIASGDPSLGDSYIAFAGAQDNGTRYRETDLDAAGHRQPTTFNQVFGGDGIGTAVVYAGSTQVYWTSLPGGSRPYCRPSSSPCNTGGVPAWTPVNLTVPSGDSQAFLVRFAPLEEDPDGSLLTQSNFNVFKIRSNASGNPTATRITAGTPGPFPAGLTIRNLWAAPKLYRDGTGAFRLYGIALGGAGTATRVAIGVDPLDGPVTWTTAPARLGPGPTTDRQVAYPTCVAFPSSAANFVAGARDRDAMVYLAASTAPRAADERSPVPDDVGRLFLTVNGGQTWQPFGVAGANRLPNVPVQVVKFDPADATDSTIYVGTDIGVYRTRDKGASWDRFGVGFPFARVTDLFISRNGSLLRASTYGRGIWEMYPNAQAPSGVKGDGDYDRNQQIDFRDVAALASRLGSTPATTAQPYYDWRSDLVGETSGIDEGDLDILLANFGGHP